MGILGKAFIKASAPVQRRQHKGNNPQADSPRRALKRPRWGKGDI